MRFVDANVFVYAFLKPRHKLSAKDVEIKESAKTILGRLDSEEMITTVCHVSEVANVVEGAGGQAVAVQVVRQMLACQNLQIVPVSAEDCFAALEAAAEFGLGVNDALAAKIMNDYAVSTIYSFDADFDAVPSIKRIRA